MKGNFTSSYCPHGALFVYWGVVYFLKTCVSVYRGILEEKHSNGLTDLLQEAKSLRHNNTFLHNPQVQGMS